MWQSLYHLIKSYDWVKCLFGSCRSTQESKQELEKTLQEKVDNLDDVTSQLEKLRKQTSDKEQQLNGEALQLFIESWTFWSFKDTNFQIQIQNIFIRMTWVTILSIS